MNMEKNKEEKKWCGECCWFCFETTDGEGQCVEVGDDGYPMMMTRCDSKACKKFVSRQEMRHHMAVLLQDRRYMHDCNVKAIRKPVDSVERGKAIEFAYKYMKVFSNL